ncbi:MAG: DNA primase, partial [Clostridia bacterium]|nr:DNA primase [Clostridia bacterium]
MALDQNFLAELKYRNDIESVISSYVQLKRRGSNLVGLCPFHNEKTPSFTVYPENGSYYCFGCSAGGDVITFVRQAENLDYIEAVRLLAQRSGMQVPEDNVDDKFAKLKKRVYEMNREAAHFFHNFLASEGGRPMLKYLRDRGLADATIRSFGLGASPDTWDSLTKHLRQKGFSDEEIITADLAIRGKKGGCYDKFRGRVMFPIMDLRGNVIAFGGRALPGQDSSQKYVNTADTPVFKKSHNLYALSAAKTHGTDRMILAEGYMDVIALHAAGFKNAVAALGTSFTEDQARLLRRYTNEVVLTLDADTAGRKATERAMSILANTGLPARVLAIPDGKDPDEFIKKNGASRFAALLDGAVSDIEYKLYTAAEGIDAKSDSGRLEYLKRAAEILSNVP